MARILLFPKPGMQKVVLGLTIFSILFIGLILSRWEIPSSCISSNVVTKLSTDKAVKSGWICKEDFVDLGFEPRYWRSFRHQVEVLNLLGRTQDAFHVHVSHSDPFQLKFGRSSLTVGQAYMRHKSFLALVILYRLLQPQSSSMSRWIKSLALYDLLSNELVRHSDWHGDRWSYGFLAAWPQGLQSFGEYCHGIQRSPLHDDYCLQQNSVNGASQASSDFLQRPEVWSYMPRIQKQLWRQHERLNAFAKLRIIQQLLEDVEWLVPTPDTDNFIAAEEWMMSLSASWQNLIRTKTTNIKDANAKTLDLKASELKAPLVRPFRRLLVSTLPLDHLNFNDDQNDNIHLLSPYQAKQLAQYCSRKAKSGLCLYSSVEVVGSEALKALSIELWRKVAREIVWKPAMKEPNQAKQYIHFFLPALVPIQKQGWPERIADMAFWRDKLGWEDLDQDGSIQRPKAIWNGIKDFRLNQAAVLPTATNFTN